MNVQPEAHAPAVSKRDLFVCFLLMGLTSFGGVLPFARRSLVDQRRWLTGSEFIELLSLGQILPGPNIVNLTIMVGRRFQGGRGALLAFGALLLAPLVIVLLIAMLYAQYGQYPAVQRIIGGTASATAGLVMAMGCTLLGKQKKSWRVTLMTLLAFVASGPLGLPLLAVIAVLAPVGIALAWNAPR